METKHIPTHKKAAWPPPFGVSTESETSIPFFRTRNCYFHVYSVPQLVTFSKGLFTCLLSLIPQKGATIYSFRGEVSQICCHFKTQKCLSVSRNNEIIVKFVINYRPNVIKLLISASGQRQSRPVWIET